MQSLNRALAATIVEDRVRKATARRAVGRSGRGPGPPGVRRPAAVLAARVARRLDAEAAGAELARPA